MFSQLVDGTAARVAHSIAAAGRSAPVVRGVGGVLVVAAALLVPDEATLAQESDRPSLSFNAYGTLGLVYSTEEHADFVENPLRPDGPGHSETLSPDVDSRLGGQVAAHLAKGLDVVFQVVAEQTVEDDYTPHLEWAYVRYDLTPDLSVRAGRTPVEAFLVSEFRKVSYANTWVRPPVELYGMVPVFSGEGIDLSWRSEPGDWTNTLQVSYGRSEGDFPGGSAEASSVWGANNTLQRGALTLRVGAATGELDIDAFDPFMDAFRAFGPEGTALAEEYEVDATRYYFASAAAEYDPGPWFARGELGWGDFNSILGEKLAGYVSGGRRLGALTPYLTYSRVGALSRTSVEGLPLAGVPPERRESAAQLNSALNFVLQSTPIQQNLSLGARWDYRPGMALKLQLDLIDMLENSPGSFINTQPGFERGGSAQVVSLATGFVF